MRSGSVSQATPKTRSLIPSELADRVRALELGIGTEVHGIDASEAMVEKLRAKRGGQCAPVNIGDFADAAVEGRPHNLLTAERYLIGAPIAW
jgi:hypothetical protein